jgi:hypothetical protein
MKLHLTIGLAVAGLALGIAPAVPADGPNYTPEYGPSTTHPSPKGKAYGFYCRGESKKHVKGEKGTAFSRCVKAMARAAQHKHMPPGRACKGTSKKHVKGEKGTAFSRCVKDVAQLRKDEGAQV